MSGIFDDILGTFRDSFRIGNINAGIKTLSFKSLNYISNLSWNVSNNYNLNLPEDNGFLISDNSMRHYLRSELGVLSQSSVFLNPITLSEISDGSFTTGNGTNNSTGTEWIELAYNANRVFIGISLAGGNIPIYGGVSQFLNGCSVQVWNGSAWETVATVSGISDSAPNQRITFTFSPISGSKIRLTRSSYIAVSEFIPLMKDVSNLLLANGPIQTAIVPLSTASRVINTPDLSGLVAVIEQPGAFSSVVPFAAFTTYPNQAVTGIINFTLAGSVKYPGVKTTYRLVSNGIHEPTFSGFLEMSDSNGYDNRNGVLNIIEFCWDGIFAWYRIFQQKGALPSFVSSLLTFPNRTASVVQVGQVYSSNTAGNWTAQMGSAQTIPANKAGRVVVRTDTLMMIGLNDVGTAQGWVNFDYAIWSGNTGVNGTDREIYTTVSGSFLASGIITATADFFFRLTRNSNGVVTAEYSADNTNWSLIRTFGNTNTNALYIASDMCGDTSTRQLEIISFEVEP